MRIHQNDAYCIDVVTQIAAAGAAAGRRERAAGWLRTASNRRSPAGNRGGQRRTIAVVVKHSQKERWKRPCCKMPDRFRLRSDRRRVLAVFGVRGDGCHPPSHQEGAPHATTKKVPMTVPTGCSARAAVRSYTDLFRRRVLIARPMGAVLLVSCNWRSSSSTVRALPSSGGETAGMNGDFSTTLAAASTCSRQPSAT